VLGFSQTREWVYPQSISGRFTTIRRWTFLGLHLLLLITPWITINGNPALLVDLPARTVYLFGSIFTSSDTIFLLLLLWFAAFALFFFTAVFGRIWCGYACPQTVFLESWIRPVEIWIEGDRLTRKRRDAQGWSFDRAWRKLAKWTVFLAVALFLSMGGMSIFAGARELWTGQAGPVEYALVAIFTGFWFIDFTWFREQFCSYVCPYARFQSVLADEETLIITYDTERGEPRKAGKQAAKDGRCIECTKCVVVCPQGIDIRDGFQLECIQCARCIDACTSVMNKLGHPTLVAYGSIAESEGRKVRRWRPRTIVYAAILVGIMVASGVLLARRIPFEATVNRAPGSLYTVDADGYTRNTFLLKITNKSPAVEPVAYEISVDGLDDAEFLTDVVELGSTETRTIPLIVRVPTSAELQRTTPFEVKVAAEDGTVVLSPTFKSGAEIGGTGS
jgi:cytochrome c oxidase accessory protein FixG